MFLSDKGPTLETLDYTIRIGSTPTFFYFDLYLNTAYAAHYVYLNINYVYHSALFIGAMIGAVHTKIDLSWIDLRSISVRFEKVFTLI